MNVYVWEHNLNYFQTGMTQVYSTVEESGRGEGREGIGYFQRTKVIRTQEGKIKDF